MKRTLPGLLLAAGWLALLVVGSPAHFSLAMLLITAIAAWEYLRMVKIPGQGIFDCAYLMLAISMPVIFCQTAVGCSGSQGGLFSGFFLVTLYFLFRYTRFENVYEYYTRVAFGVFYVGMLASYLVMLRHQPEGGSWLVVLSAVTAGSDSGAYFFGSNFGKHKLCPAISPKKTIEGAVGGLFCGLAAALFFGLLLFDRVDWLFLVVAAVLLTCVGILGDLTESMIKRGTGTKDSGTLLAGHGGVLDRIDSLLLAAPVLFYLLIVLGGE